MTQEREAQAAVPTFVERIAHGNATQPDLILNNGLCGLLAPAKCLHCTCKPRYQMCLSFVAVASQV